LDVSLSTPLTLVANTYTTVPMTVVNIDNYSGYNTSTYKYTIPMTGYYSVTTRFRPADNTASANFSHGGSTGSNVDGTWMLWYITNSAYVTGLPAANTKNGTLNNRVSLFTVGQQINMYAISSRALTTHASNFGTSMTINLVSL